MPKLSEINVDDWDVSENIGYHYPHWLMRDKKWWSRRKPSDSNIEKLRQISNTSFEHFLRKVEGGTIDFENEASMQMQLAAIFKAVGQLFEYRPVDLFRIELESSLSLEGESVKSNSEKALVDIMACIGSPHDFATCAVELKSFKQKNGRDSHNRYDVFSDLFNLELYRDTYVDIAYFFLLTDHKHYHSAREYSGTTSDFDFRHGVRYSSGKKLEYRSRKVSKKPITLRNDYQFGWTEHTTFDTNAREHKKLYCLQLEL